MRVVDIDRIGVGSAPSGVNEAWITDPAARSSRWTTSMGIPVGGRPQLVVRPGPLAELERDVERNREAGGPRTVRLCPGPAEHDYPLEDWVLRPLPEYCDSESIAVLIDPGPSPAAYPWAGVVRLARDHPSLVVVALGPPLGGPTAARALDAAPNLVFSTSGLTDESGEHLRRLAETAGSHRFAYGSGDRAIPPSAVASFLPDAIASDVLSGTADRIDQGTWGPTWL